MEQSDEERPSSAPEINTNNEDGNPDASETADPEAPNETEVNVKQDAVEEKEETAESNEIKEVNNQPEEVVEEKENEQQSIQDGEEVNSQPDNGEDNREVEDQKDDGGNEKEVEDQKDDVADDNEIEDQKNDGEDDKGIEDQPDESQQIEPKEDKEESQQQADEVQNQEDAATAKNEEVTRPENKTEVLTAHDVSSDTPEEHSILLEQEEESKKMDETETDVNKEKNQEDSKKEESLSEEAQTQQIMEESQPDVPVNDAAVNQMAFSEKAIEHNVDVVNDRHRNTLANRDLVSAVALTRRSMKPENEIIVQENVSSDDNEESIEDANYSVVGEEKKLEENSSDELAVNNPLTALVPIWSFGLNRAIPVINLSTDSRRMIFYTCAHLGVLYQYETNEQTVLQGHSNPLTCTAASQDKRWLVTGDKGKNNMVIIWDSNTGIPVRSMFDPHDNGVVAVAITPDARYLATIGAPPHQMFSLWDWTTGDEFPVVSCTIDMKFGIQSHVLFNPNDPHFLVSNSDSQVIFYSWKNQTLEFYAPPLTEKDFNKPVGKFSNSVFLPNSTKALTATSQGLCAVWDSNKPLVKVSKEATANKKAVKLVPMHDRAITVLLVLEKFIVSGDTAGHVKFFDHNLMLMYWYDNFNFGPINAISFQYNSPEPESTPSKKKRDLSEYPTDTTIPENYFIVEDFVIGTSNAIFASVTVEGNYVNIIIRDHDSSIDSIAAHPCQERVATAGMSGLLKVWNYRTRITIVSRYFDRNNQITAISFDPKGIFLAVGFLNGQLRVLDAESLQDVCKEPFSYARDRITKIVFSNDSKLMATVDTSYTTSLYEAGPLTEQWIYLARHRAHYKPIKDIMFGVFIDSDEPRLLSIGEDRLLVEYDLETATQDNLPVLSSNKIEQSALPLCMTWYPSDSKEQFILTSNKEFKFKLYNSTTFMCRKTVLSPTYGSPVEKMIVLPSENEEEKKFLIFHIYDQVGMVMFPLDGNPHNAMSMIAHPTGISNLTCSFDGQFVFTSGGSDSTVHMWRVCKNVLEAQSKLGGDGLVPFYDLLEGGREGELFAQMEDYFYYAQLRSQGIDTTDTRSVSTKMPVAEIPFVMRALGFYPTEQEIENMLNEVKFMEFVDTGQFKQDLDLGEFINLYINHRPAFGLSLEKIQWAFDVLGVKQVNQTTGEEDDQLPLAIKREDLFDLLQSKGEHMMEYELAEYLTTLLGFNPEGGSCELDEFDPSSAGDLLESHISQQVTAEQFASDVLCLGPALFAASPGVCSVEVDTAVTSDRPNTVSQQSQTCHLVDL